MKFFAPKSEINFFQICTKLVKSLQISSKVFQLLIVVEICLIGILLERRLT